MAGVNWTPSQQLVQGPVKVEAKVPVGGLPWPKPVSSTRMALKSGAELVAVRVAKGEVILCHWTVGWPTMTSPKLRVLLGVVRMEVPVPLRETKAGEVPLPAVTLRRPWRVPGCEGAKVMSAVQVLLPGSRSGQSVVSVKSPVRERLRAKGWVPMLPMVTGWVVAEVPVTRTGVGKVMVEGLTVRLGLADWPTPVDWDLVVPVMRTVRP